jgi:putative tricarboxylic transport membrane protein
VAAVPRARAAQDIAAGAVVVTFGAAVLVALSNIPTAKFQAISAALFPRVCAWALVACGLALLLRGLLRSGKAIAWPRWRGTVLIVLSVVAFGLVAPRFGYAVAGFLTLVISGFATKEARPLQLFIFASGMIAFSVVLFSVVLKVPMPAVVLPGFRF